MVEGAKGLRDNLETSGNNRVIGDGWGREGARMIERKGFCRCI
jgi:hypothetical protein